MEWTGWSPDVFDDGVMTYKVKELTGSFIEKWIKCHALVGALTVLRDFITPGAILADLVGKLVAGLQGLIEPEFGLAGIKYKACKLSAWSGIRTDLYDELYQLN